MRRAVAWVTVAAIVLACASKGTVASQLRFVDSDMFEKDLIASMKADQPTITVAFAGTDATMSNMPDRLEKWLFVINERDDTEVKFEPDPSFLTPKNPYGYLKRWPSSRVPAETRRFQYSR